MNGWHEQKLEVIYR